MVSFLLFLIIVASALLIIAVFVQNPKGGGLTSDLGSSTQFGGVQRTTDMIEKITWGLSAVIVVLAIVTSSMMKQKADVVRDGEKAAIAAEKAQQKSQQQQGKTKKQGSK